jgi:hypothetical protein
MKKIILIIGIVFLSGCGMTPVKHIDPNFIDNLREGRVTLSGGGCGFTWGASNQAILSNLSGERWHDLANLIKSLECSQDSAYYFLGRSAEGLGFKNAAKKYYKTSINNSKVGNHLYSCASMLEYNCWGFKFPQDSETRLSQLKIYQFKDMPMVLEVTESGRTFKLSGIVKDILGNQNDVFGFFNDSGIKVCSGEFNLNRSKSRGSVSLNCFNGKFSGTGEVLSSSYNESQGTYSGVGLIKTPSTQIRMLYGPNVSSIE